MTYIYPQFSDFEVPGVRLAGPGLGNLLFIYFRAWLAAKEHGYAFIWPTWPSVKPGAIIRREKDKRFYGDLFRNRSGYVDGLKKQSLIRRRGAVRVNERNYDFSRIGDGAVILYKYFHMDFEDLVPHADEIREEIVRNLSRKSRRGLEGDMSRCVNIHVRLGDFASNVSALNAGKNNTRIGVGWYAAIVRKLKGILGEDVAFNVFSDGSDEERLLRQQSGGHSGALPRAADGGLGLVLFAVGALSRPVQQHLLSESDQGPRPQARLGRL